MTLFFHSGATVNSDGLDLTVTLIPIEYTVTFDANGGTGVMAPVTTVGNGRYTLPACGFTREGYEFDCWQIGTHSYPPGSVITMTGDMTVRAIWRKYCTVTFNANGGTGSAEPVTVLAGTQITLPENPFTSETRNFSYWAVSSLPNVKKYPGGTFTVTQNTTVTAVWVPKVWCTLTFNMNGYGTQIPPITVEKGTIVS